MDTWKIVLMIFIALLVIFTAVVSATNLEADADADTTVKSSTRGVYRIVDDSAGVVCWVYVRGGISCLSIESTLLGK